MNWNYIAAMPLVRLSKAVDFGDIAVVSSDDNRYKILVESDANLETYLSSFSNPFGQKLHPAIIIKQSADKINILI